MFATIQSFINSATHSGSDADQENTIGLQLAAAALMVEVAVADFKQCPKERDTLLNALQKSFPLDSQALQQLISDAEQHQSNATSLYEFTSVLNQHCSQQEKFEILVNLWRVAFADGELDKYEDHRIRRIAELLNLSHREFIQSKLKVQT